MSMLIECQVKGFDPDGNPMYTIPDAIRQHWRTSSRCTACDKEMIQRPCHASGIHLGRWMNVCPNYVPYAKHDFWWLANPTVVTENIEAKVEDGIQAFVKEMMRDQKMLKSEVEEWKQSYFAYLDKSKKKYSKARLKQVSLEGTIRQLKGTIDILLNR